MKRCKHRCYPALLLMVLFAMPAAVSNAEPRIGVTASTRPSAEGVIGANSQTLSPGSELYANETVRTGNRGQADLVLLDNTNLIVGSTSEVLLDKFLYDRICSSGSVVLQATRGTLRVVTGSQDPVPVNLWFARRGPWERTITLRSGIVPVYLRERDFSREQRMILVA